MVATTKGPANAGEDEERGKPRKKTTEDKKLQAILDFSEEEWGHLASHAASRSVTPEQAIRLAIEATYGRPMVRERQQAYGPQA